MVLVSLKHAKKPGQTESNAKVPKQYGLDIDQALLWRDEPGRETFDPPDMRESLISRIGARRPDVRRMVLWVSSMPIESGGTRIPHRSIGAVADWPGEPARTILG
jgi:hypothetical protein